MTNELAPFFLFESARSFPTKAKDGNAIAQRLWSLCLYEVDGVPISISVDFYAKESTGREYSEKNFVVVTSPRKTE